MKDDLVTVIVVNYNGRAYLDACLASLRAQSLPAHRFEVVVVDNGSRDGSAEWLRRAWPGVTVVEAGANLGFAGGNNAGMDRAHGRLFALLNNDAVADPFWLEEMLRAAGVRTAGVAAKLVFLAEPGVIDSAGLRLLRDGRGKDVGFREPDRGQFERPREVFGGCGAGVLLRADALDDGGRLDERLFMYYEDLDLAWRCRLGGGRFAYAPRAVVRHVHCGSSGAGSPFVRFHVERNRALAGARNGDPVLALLAVLGLVGRAGRAGLRWLRDRRRDPSAAASFRAHLRAGLSFLYRCPGFFLERFRRGLTARRP